MPTPARATGALLDRLEALVALAGRRRGLALMPSGALAGAEVRAIAATAGLPAGAAGEVALLTAVAVAVGLLRVRGQRLEVTSLRAPWSRIDRRLRAGIVYASWCHRMPWPSVLGPDPAVAALHARRLPILRLLHGLPAAVDVDVAELAVAAAPPPAGQADPGAATPTGDRPAQTAARFAAAFLAPLAALGVAELHPPPPATPSRLRLAADARTVVAAALLAAGEDVPTPPVNAN
jgi:hypothetical protein